MCSEPLGEGRAFRRQSHLQITKSLSPCQGLLQALGGADKCVHVVVKLTEAKQFSSDQLKLLLLRPSLLILGGVERPQALFGWLKEADRGHSELGWGGICDLAFASCYNSRRFKPAKHRVGSMSRFIGLGC